jgi:centrosomal protein CEP78
LALKYCRIGDSNVEVLCKSLKTSKAIVSVDFSGCCLTGKGGKTVAEFIQHQATERHSEAWKESLRHQEPSLDSMNGLKRVTLCSNPLLGDKGVVALCETLKDDLWLKAIDLQQCGITNTGAHALQNVMTYNTNLVVIDIRLNPLIDPALRDAFLDQVTANAATDVTQDMFPWLPLASSAVSTSKHQTTVRSTKKGIRSSTVHQNTKWRRNVGHSSQTMSPRMLNGIKPQKGLPWRTAARSLKHWGKTNACESSTDTSSASSPSSYASDQVGFQQQSIPDRNKQTDRGIAQIQQDLRQLQIEVETC